MHDLTKKERKLAGEIISASVEKEFEAGLKEADVILQKWKDNKNNGREIFHELRDYLNEFRKHLAFRYDGVSGSEYLFTVAAIFRDGYITEEDIKDFSDEAKETIRRINAID